MDLEKRNGRWHACVWVIKNGQRKRLYRSTGVLVDGRPGSRAYRMSHDLAKQRANDIARNLQLEASGLVGQERPAATLQQALSTLLRVRKNLECDQRFFNAMFEFFDPNLSVEDIETNDLQDFAAHLVRSARPRELVAHYVEVVHGAVNQERTETIESPSSAFMVPTHAIFDTYFKSVRLKPKTVAGYQTVAAEFKLWCLDNDIYTPGHITADQLAEFALHLQTKPKNVPLKGGKSGERIPSDEPRSTYSVNRDLTGISAMLNYMRDKRMLPHLSLEDVSKPLGKLSNMEARKPFLSRKQIKDLLQEAQKYECGDFIRFMLLTGLRAGEGRTLEWHEVDLDNQNLLLTPSKVKTNTGRLVDLAISPSLVPLLERLSNGTGSYVFGGDNPAKDFRRQIARLPFHGLQELRRTCATYLACMPAYGIHRATIRGGHSVEVSQRLYAGHVRVSPDARTLEEAMGIAA